MIKGLGELLIDFAAVQENCKSLPVVRFRNALLDTEVGGLGPSCSAFKESLNRQILPTVRARRVGRRGFLRFLSQGIQTIRAKRMNEFKERIRVCYLFKEFVKFQSKPNVMVSGARQRVRLSNKLDRYT